MRKYLCILLLLLSNFSFAKNTVTDYQRIFSPTYTSDGVLMIALRVFKMNDIPSFLLVDPNTLVTKVVPISTLKPRNQHSKENPGNFTFSALTASRYYQLLNKNTAAPYIMENQGATHAAQDKGAILTIDLCPSRKPFETDFFNKLVQLSRKSYKPVPITIAISGFWLIEHPDEFQWLLKQEKEQNLKITWANHSFSHVYYADLPYSENFLLSPGTNVDSEILLTEKYLLEAGELPSVFFRFPGLVSNESLVKQIKQYGLIPLGTDAWIADLQMKHQELTPGGIILVHGNSNEHKGIELLMPLLDKLTLVSITQAL